MDARFKNESVFVVAGPSSSGKTVFVRRLIKHTEQLFRKPVHKVRWFYGTPGDGDGDSGDEDADQLSIAANKVTMHKGLPSGWTKLVEPYDLVVLDDLLTESAGSKELTTGFTRLAHHRPCTLIYVTQNLYHRSADARTRNLNTHYLVLMNNPRDATQIVYIARQMFPKQSNALVDIYQEVTRNQPYSYLLLDFHQDTPAVLRIRTNIFPDDSHNVVYKI